ncbi:L,D-transpeptidase family protein [Kaistia terrae]|uniref:Murein L,D-transpeptidase n=1 Tax=Kaistia terrae TaxID=537017 RepID=A0ABW0PSL5_9HYPH|nr:L,D-transpeptidase family protein [Kaistia terrae]MCX5578400.1 L,D-transpeptidase family protein [Kaistia terrae]
MRRPFSNAPIRQYSIRLFAGAFLAFATLLPSGPSAEAATVQEQQRNLAVIRINAIDLLAREKRLPLPIQQRRDVLRAYYEEQAGELLWLRDDRAEALVAILNDAGADGLRPDDYPTRQLMSLMQNTDPEDVRGLALIELFFSAAFLEYSGDLSVGRFLPAKVDPNFFLKTRTFDQAAALQAVSNADDLVDFFDALQPPSDYYASLRGALAQYRELAMEGGWDLVPLGPTLKPGMTDPRVADIRERLSITDGADPEPQGGDETYDAELVKAVERFQARHGLDVDGVVGPAVLVAMNVPIEDRVQEIELAMERWRWMPRDLGQQYLMVNIAGFELRRVKDGRAEERMSVVVGKPYSRTPVFSDQVRYIEINPYWTVPSGLAVKEELGKLRSNPGGLASQGFEAVRGKDVYDLRSINWANYGPGNFPFQLRQQPGPKNALGRVKFMFPNEHSVYLHDTPSRSLFSKAERAFSHGCIRLSRPLELALQVLTAGGVSGWNMDRINSVVATEKNTVVKLATPLPIHLTYLTAWVDEDGVNFRKDIYNQDAKLLAALDGKALAW